MRMQISIPTALLDRLHELARQEHRDPKQQAEILLYRAIEQAVRDHSAPDDGQRLEASYAPAQAS